MKFLDIDLDFFQEEIVHCPSGGRLSEKYCAPWTKTKCRHFLESRCGLSKKSPIPGRFAIEHAAVFDYWDELKTKNTSLLTMEVTHVDAHADLGLGDASWGHLMGDVLLKNVEERRSAERGPHRLSSGSYLAYGIACRWISKLEYVHPVSGGNDLAWFHFKDFDINTNIIQLRAYDEGFIRHCMSGDMQYRIRQGKPLHFEPDVPFKKTPEDKWKSSGEYDAAFLCQSPNYTSRKTDNLISVICEYINFR